MRRRTPLDETERRIVAWAARNDPSTSDRISGALGVHRTTVQTLLVRLERRGWMRRERSRIYPKALLYRLTAAGLRAAGRTKKEKRC